MPRLLRLLNVAVLASICLALVWRSGLSSVGSWVGLLAGVLVLAFGMLALLGRSPLAPVVRRVARPRTRMFFAVAPWLALLVTVMAAGLWWSQQAWPFRLLATYALALWSMSWLIAAPKGNGASSADSGDATAATAARFVRHFLLGFAVVLIVLGVNGLAFGASSFGVAVSALMSCAAAAVASVALFARHSTRDTVLTASFGIILGLACVEGGVRVLHLGESLLEVDNPEYVRQFHHITPPNSAFLSQPKPLDEFPAVVVETNSLGIRGPEIPPGPVDLLLIGDSMIEARQLPWEQTLSARLPEAFRARSAQFRAVGHGVRGWAPLLEWNWYLKVGRRLKPQTVLLFFFWNDLWVAGDEVRTFQAVLRPDGRPDYFDVPVEPDWVWYKPVRTVRLAESLAQRVGLTALRRALSMIGEGPELDLAGAEALARRMAGDALLTPTEIDALLTEPMERLNPRLQRVARAEFWPSTRPFRLWTDTQRQAADRTEDELRLFAEDVRADGGRLVIVHVPNAYQIAPTECSVARYLVGLDGDRLLPLESGIQTWLKGVTDRHGIVLLDPSDAMREYHRSQSAPVTPLFLRSDCHWSARGHQLMADYLADWYVRTRASQQ